MPKTKPHLTLLTFPIPRKYFPLLALLALMISSLACMDTEIDLVVTRDEDQQDSLEVEISRSLYDSYLSAAKEINQERIQDFQAAGRKPDPEKLLPETAEEFGDLFKTNEYEDQGYSVTSTSTGFRAVKIFSPGPRQETEDWMVKITTPPDHPELTNYRAKIFLDLTELEGSLFELRSQPLPPKPNPNPEAGGGSSSSGGSLGDVFSLFGNLTAEAEQAMSIELWYAQKALQQSDPIEYRLSIQLPGVIVQHKLSGETAGTVDGNTVSLILDESSLMANAGKKLVFVVDSVLKDCSQACDKDYHLIWDEDEESVSCNCVCESGWKKMEGENACIHCDTICSWSDPNLVRNLENCQTDNCACSCKAGYEINNAGNRCITNAEAEAEDNQQREDGGPSRTQIGEVVTGFMLGLEGNEINQLPGWYLLTSKERENLLALVESLGIAVDRSQLIIDLGSDLTADQHLQQINEEKNRLDQITEMAISRLEDQINDRRRVQEVIIKEIGGLSSLGIHLVSLPDYVQHLFQTPRELATDYVKGQLTDEVKNRILQETHGGSPAMMEEAAAELIKQIPYMATNSCVDDYYLYKEYYRANCSSGCVTEDDARHAHELALETLKNNVGPNRELWSSPGEAYDRAFWTLNNTLGK